MKIILNANDNIGFIIVATVDEQEINRKGKSYKKIKSVNTNGKNEIKNEK